MSTNLKISVDGSFVDKEHVYGAVIIQNQNTKQITTYRVDCKNNELTESRNVYGEVAAASLAVLFIEEAIKEDPTARITLIYDYIGIKKWATGEWSANKPISKYYKALWKAKEHIMPNVTFIHQKGHSGITDENSYLNDLADQVAGLRLQPNFVTGAIF